MKILYYTKYSRRGASSRLRSYQYFPFLEKEGFEVSVSPLFDDRYLEHLYTGKSVLTDVVKAYIKRFFSLFRVKKYNCLVIEKELFPYIPAIFEKLLALFNVKYIVDYDDAIFHNYDLGSNPVIRFFLKKKIDKVMRYSRVVVAGNSYLANKALQARAKDVQIIPTVIDIDRYKEKQAFSQEANEIVIGWIGTISTIRHVKDIQEVLKKLVDKYNVSVCIVGVNDSLGLGDNEKHVEWSEESEVDSILTFDIGIMPLIEGAFEKGKCGYKIIQYMGCGLPVVATAFGANVDIIKQGYNGYLAESKEDWYNYLEKYILDVQLSMQHGKNGRLMAEDIYSVQKQLSKYNDIFAEL